MSERWHGMFCKGPRTESGPRKEDDRGTKGRSSGDDEVAAKVGGKEMNCTPVGYIPVSRLGTNLSTT